jgi:hypothetical protein
MLASVGIPVDDSIVAYSGVDDFGFNQIKDRVAKVDLGIPSTNVIHHQDMSSDQPTTHKALYSVWVRVHGLGSKIESGQVSYFEENKVTRAIKSTQMLLTRQGPRDIQVHTSVPYKLDNLPDSYANGATSKRAVAHSASAAIEAKGKLLVTTSKPPGAEKQYVTKLITNVNAPGADKPTDVYMNVLQYVVSCDENAKYGATSVQTESIGLIISTMMREELNPKGKPSTAPDMVITNEVFTPNNWPSILPPTCSSVSSGEIELTTNTALPDVIPRGIAGAKHVVGAAGGKLGRNLNLNPDYIYSVSGASF